MVAVADAGDSRPCRVRLGRDGADGVLPLGPLSVHERACFAKMLPELKDSIQKGVQFAQK
jgi:malate dehydrogenase